MYIPGYGNVLKSYELKKTNKRLLVLSKILLKHISNPAIEFHLICFFQLRHLQHFSNSFEQSIAIFFLLSYVHEC